MARAYRDLGACLYSKRSLPEAQQCFRCALAIDRVEHGESHLDVASDLNWLGTALEASGEVAEAEPLLRRALGIVQGLIEAPHRRLASAFNNLANNRKLAKSFDEAHALYLQALENYERGGGKPDNLSSVHNALAQVLLGKQELASAEHHARLALAIDEQLHGAEHEELTGTLIWLGQILSAQGRHAEADVPLRRALAIDERVHGESSSDVLIDLSWLGRVLLDAQRWAEAEPIYRRRLSIERERRARPRDVALAQDKLSLVLHELGRAAESEVLLREALGFYEANLRDYLDDLPEVYLRLARSLDAQGRDAEAGACREHAAQAANKAQA
jgi:tetratricopeptide (TPR) repeat protein